MRAYYNEFDPKAAQWLRNLIAAGHLPAGDVDERSIEDVTPNELRGYTQCHFFAGIGGWPLALALAGWPAGRPVWTGSCPCQPFSAAGKGAGFADERHLWPAWQHLIAQCRPPVIFGEQVASKDAEPWIDLVHADLEGMGYAFGCVPFPAAGVGAPHIRDRTYWVADAGDYGLQGRLLLREGAKRGDQHGQAGYDGATVRTTQPASCSTGRLADADLDRQPPRGLPVRPGRQDEAATFESGACAHGGLGNARSERTGRHTGTVPGAEGEASVWAIGDRPQLASADDRPGPTNGQWGSADWLCCTDGKWRPVEPGTFPLAHGIPGRVGRLRAYGNAIVPAQAAEFIQAFLESEPFL